MTLTRSILKATRFALEMVEKCNCGPDTEAMIARLERINLYLCNRLDRQ